MTIVRIDRRFRGPPESGNGGYFAGLLAREFGGSDVVVTLKRPAPLGVDLRVERAEDEAALYHGGELLAVAERQLLELDVPVPPTFADARAAERRFAPNEHVYPGCFVCGPERDEGDGWRIFPGSIGEGRVAAVWTPGADCAAGEAGLKPEFVWAALDCPGYFAVEQAAGLALLGRIAVRIDHPVPVGKPLIVQGWAIGSDGRKHRAGTALHDSGGMLVAAAAQVWVSLR